MTGRLLEQLTVALLVKFPTFNLNLLLFIVFNNIQQFDVTLFVRTCLTCKCVYESVCLFSGSNIGNFRRYFVHSNSSMYFSYSVTHKSWIIPSTPRKPLCSMVLQYLLNTSSVTNGISLFGQRLTGLISPFLTCSSVSMMSPSNLPLLSHALCNSLTSATKLTVTYCV